MKISGPGAVGPTTTPKRTRKVGDTGEKFANHLASEDATAAAVGSSSPLAAVDALLALQEVPNATDGRSRGLKRAEALLAGLDEIRQGLLIGVIPKDRLQGLVHAVRDKREATDDPRLNAVLDEIELRAAVELAKLDQLS